MRVRGGLLGLGKRESIMWWEWTRKEKERNEVMRQKDMKTKQGLEAVKSLTSKNTKLRDEMSKMEIAMGSAAE